MGVLDMRHAGLSDCPIVQRTPHVSLVWDYVSYYAVTGAVLRFLTATTPFGSVCALAGHALPPRLRVRRVISSYHRAYVVTETRGYGLDSLYSNGCMPY